MRAACSFRRYFITFANETDLLLRSRNARPSGQKRSEEHDASLCRHARRGGGGGPFDTVAISERASGLSVPFAGRSLGWRDLGAALTVRPTLIAPPIRLDNLTLGYDRHPAVHHLDGVIASGESLAVCGPNGAGKSTLLKALAGLLAPLGGRIDRSGADARDVAYLPQLADIDRDFPIDLGDFVALGATRRIGWLGKLTADETLRATSALRRVSLEGMEARPIGTLSGGQMQRALFARLIVQDQPTILLDEPFGAIDESTANELLDLIEEWVAEGRSVVAVLHDLDLARRAFPHTLLLARRRIAWGATADVLTPENLTRARAMSAAYDSEARECLIDETAAHDH